MRVKRTELGVACLLFTALGACASDPGEVPLAVPRGYATRLQVTHQGHLHGFGPFVGYYFRPLDPKDLTRLEFLCFNEGGFYSSDAPRNALLYRGEARLVRLPAAEVTLGGQAGDRIRPLFARDLPESWLAAQPPPSAEYRHFHSCYDARGAAPVGYWLRHVAARPFTYDMGGRVAPGSPLHHGVTPGPDLAFAHSVEFDRGPGGFP